MDIVHEVQDLTYLQWSKIRNSSGTAGSFLKAYSDFQGQKIYYKLSNYDSFRGIVGHECINEIIVARLLTLLGIEHLNYKLVHAKIVIDGKEITTYVCASEDFKQKNEAKVALDVFYQAERRNNESMMEFCQRQYWEKYIYEMLVVDYLILNRDRHGANIEVLRNRQKKTLRLAPLFDHGLSLIFSCHTETAMQKVDVMEDKPVQCCVGSHSAQANLQLIPQTELPQLHPLRPEDKHFILQDMDKLMPTIWQEQVWDMLWKRWCYYESLCHKR